MYKTYFKQAVEMLKQNKFFSIISILGTALAIMMVMAIIVTNEIKNISVAPENNRDRTLYISYQYLKDSIKGNVNTYSGSLAYEVIKDYIPHLKTPELIAVHSYSNAIVSTETSAEEFDVKIKYTNPEYWKMLSFRFLSGKTFGEEEFLSGVHHAVISESMAKKLFKGEAAIGRTVLVDFQPYRVVGVVQDVSSVFTEASAEIWMPYTTIKRTDRSGFTVMLLTKDKKDIPAIQEELRMIEKRFHENEKIKTLYLRGPETHRVSSMGVWGNNENQVAENVKIQNRKIGFILIIILLVPAINLSGLNLSRIRKRTPEIGVRKAFGAKKHVIIIQILWENLITSLIGGMIGSGLSVLVIFRLKNWLLNIPAESNIPFDTILSVPVILFVFLACIVINVLSAAIPAYRASRLTIVNSITNNDKTS